MICSSFEIFSSGINVMRIPKGQSKKDNPEKLTTRQRKTEQNKNTIQYVLDTTIQKQT